MPHEEELLLTVPAMWADHHVLAARRLLTRLDGVRAVAASSLGRRVSVTFAPGKVDHETIIAALTAGGYEPGDLEAAPAPERAKPAWTHAPRVTTTDPDDLALSGDYRQY